MATSNSDKKGLNYKNVGAAILAVIGSVFALEAGFSNNPKDPGGATNHGVTEAVARKHDYHGPMQNLPKEFAADIYYKDYILKPGYVPVLELSPALGEELVDSGVNAGPGRSSVWFQIALNALNRDGKDYPQIVEDGKVGPGTINAYKALVRVRGRVPACQMMIKIMDAQQTMHYLSLTNLKTFTPGWINHRVGNVPLEKCNDTVG